MNSKVSQTRHDYIDYLRGLLVFLVAYGHTIQYVAYRNNGTAFFDDPIFKLIYIFHMPLFMAISGFVSFYSVTRHSAADTIKKRFRQLIIPILSWAIISSTALFLAQRDFKHAKSELIMFLPKLMIHEFLDSFWFLWCVFGATLIVLILKKWNFDRLSGLTLMCLFILFLPIPGNFYLFAYMLPFFCAGYLLAKSNSLNSQSKVNFFKLALGLTLSLVCFLLWHQNTYVYLSKTSFAHGNYVNIILRYVGGFVLSLTFMMLSWTLFSSKLKHSFVCTLGKNSLAIYILQTYAFFIIERTHTSLAMPLLTMLLLSPSIAAFICVLAYAIARFLYKYPLPSRLILGC